ncbi:hypothetical protein NM688_g651 [Phlebia brevispora]|uniref:Uncharacterized protein n=1 Tax=Phlebia brevispora TaxID=194682 RepID=A0ACC1TDE1_9APHY|nr:hypothetical protein NM688_g651 [Phlebia brevispora]
MPRSNSRLNKNIDKTLELSKTILESGKDVLQLAPIGGLDTAAGALVTFIGMIQQARGNAEAREKLANQIQELANIIKDIAENSRRALQGADREAWGEGPAQVSLSPALQKRINVLVGELEAIRDDADKLRKHNVLSRFLYSKLDAETLKGFQARLKNATDVFMLGSQATVEHFVNEIKMMLTPRTDDLLKDLKALAVQTSYREEYNKAKSRYLKGTRSTVLADLEMWAVGGGDLNQYSVFVLSGVAGTGKSTIAYEFARWLDDRNMLGATFFFVRGSEQFSTTRFVLPTIAYQLAMLQDSLFPHIAKASQDHLKRGQQQQSNYQLDDLIVKPLQEVADTSYNLPLPVIVIIDAIDECAPNDQPALAFLLSNLIPKVQQLAFPLRVLITTRPELRIMNTLYFQRFHQVKLHEIPRPSVDSDIAHYFETGLSHFIYREAFIAKRPAAIRQLTEAAEGLFIYASTALDFLTKDVDHSDQAVENLNALLSAKGSGIGSHLDQLYLSVLTSAFPTHVLERGNYRARVAGVLGAIALLQDSVSPNTLQVLAGIEVSTTQGILKRLGSLVIAEDNPDSEFRPLHATFPQFLIDPSHRTDHAFYVDPTPYHGSLAVRCLELITSQDALRSDKRRTSHVKYSCVHWATHLSLANPTEELSRLLDTFFHNNLLLWFEALSDIGRLEIAGPVLDRVRKWFQTQSNHGPSSLTLALLNDAYRFILLFFDPIRVDPKHIYVTALPLTPHCALLDVYGSCKPLDGAVLRITTERESHWGPCLRVMEGHKGTVLSVRFSSDGRHIVSGSCDHTIKIWDTETGVMLNTMQCRGWIYSVAFRPDMNTGQIASADDRTMRIWDFSSGAELHKIQLDETGAPLGLAYSPDGKYILLASYNGPPSLWDVSNRKLLARLYSEPQTSTRRSRHLHRSVAWSPDGSKLAIGYKEQVQIWNAQDPYGLIKNLTGHTSPVTSIVFTHDNKRIISGALDETLRVWHINSGIYLKVLEGYSSAVAISATLIASASDVIRLWDAKSYTLTRVLNSPNNINTSLAFSPDGDRLLSGSTSSTLCLWDTSYQAREKTPSGYSSVAATCMTFSGDGALIATGSEKGTVMIWETKTGKLLRSAEPSTILRTKYSLSKSRTGVKHIIFSPDQKELAFSRHNEPEKNSIWVLDVNSGEVKRVGCQPEHERRPGIIGISYSPDGKWLSAGFRQAIFSGYPVSDPLCIWQLGTSGWSLHRSIWAGADRLAGLISPGGIIRRGAADLEFSPDSTSLRYQCSKRRDMFKYIYDVTTGDQLDEAKHNWKTASVVALFKEQDGWIISTETKKKLCWIPESKRSYRMLDSSGEWRTTCASYESYYATGSEAGEVTIFDLSELVKK